MRRLVAIRPDRGPASSLEAVDSSVGFDLAEHRLDAVSALG